MPEDDELSADSEDKPGNGSRLSVTATPEKNNNSCKVIKQSFEVTDEHLRRLAPSPKQSSVNQPTPSRNDEHHESPNEMNTSEEPLDIVEGVKEPSTTVSNRIDDEIQLAQRGGGSTLVRV